MAVWNLTRCSYLGRRLIQLNENFPRTLLHLNDTGIPAGCALWISPCQGIYTVGMRKTVDIAFLDGDMKVVKMLRKFPPGCFAEPAEGSVSALELPADTLAETGTSLGDTVVVDPA